MITAMESFSNDIRATILEKRYRLSKTNTLNTKLNHLRSNYKQLQIDELVRKHMEVLCDEYHMRVARAKKGHISVLMEGFWLATDYYDVVYALLQSKKTPQEIKAILRKRRDAFVEQNVFVDGIPPFGMKHVLDEESITGKTPYTYILQGGVTPREVIASFRRSFSFVNAAIIYQLIVYEVVQLLGEMHPEKFYFAERLSSHSVTSLSLLYATNSNTLGEKRNRGFQKGFFYQATGHADVIYRHPLRRSHRDYFLCIDTNPERFLGLGFTTSRGATEHKILKRYARDCNRSRHFDDKMLCRRELVDLIIFPTHRFFLEFIKSFQESSATKKMHREEKQAFVFFYFQGVLQQNNEVKQYIQIALETLGVSLYELSTKIVEISSLQTAESIDARGGFSYMIKQNAAAIKPEFPLERITP